MLSPSLFFKVFLVTSLLSLAPLRGLEIPANFLVNVVRMNAGHEKETVDDLKNMYQQGMIQAAVFSFALVPEGTPVTDKATPLAETYRRHTELLKDCEMPAGILLQATVGHGWVPEERSSFQKFVFRSGAEPYIHCPLDPDFQEYIRTSLKTVAEAKPDFVMLDDDTRALTGRGGCFCPLHIRDFNRLVQGNYTADELREAIQLDDALAHRWDDFQQSAFLALAKAVREGMDAVDPSLPGTFCCCYGDVRHAKKMAEILAAPGQRPIVRINNALYLNDSSQVFPNWMYKTAIQLAALEGCTVLAETDTCPQKRYSTSYQILHLQYAWSLLNGCSGGKLWVTGSPYNPLNGAYYRKRLARFHGFYEEVSRMKPEFQGFIEPMPRESPFNAVAAPNGVYPLTLGGTLLARLGLPMAFTKNVHPDDIVMLSGETVPFFSDGELRKFLSGRVFLEGNAAVELSRRGFDDLMGVTALPWGELPSATMEVDAATGEQFAAANSVLLKPQADAQVLSMLHHAAFAAAKETTPVAPGAVLYKNRLGGEVLSFYGNLGAFDLASKLFSLLHVRFKQRLAEWYKPQIWYAEDAPVTLHLFHDRGNLTLCVLNGGLDPLEGLPLEGLGDRTDVQMLQPDGSWKKVNIVNATIQTDIPAMDIAFFRLDEAK
ncbi:MAG: hypothetical protein MJ202_09310 [Lentisphaeria bacterium]|nr:hypothetical protein [Lentisphaeria bacterium]